MNHSQKSRIRFGFIGLRYLSPSQKVVTKHSYVREPDFPAGLSAEIARFLKGCASVNAGQEENPPSGWQGGPFKGKHVALPQPTAYHTSTKGMALFTNSFPARLLASRSRIFRVA